MAQTPVAFSSRRRDKKKVQTDRDSIRGHSELKKTSFPHGSSYMHIEDNELQAASKT